MRQVQEADKKLWQIISEKIRGNVAVQADGTKPVEKALEEVCNSPEVTFLLSPLPKLGQSSDVKGDKKDNKPAIKDSDVVKKVKDPKKEFKFPDGCVAHTDSKKPICRNFNLGRCKFAQPGKRCKYGLHVCWKQGCHRPKQGHECTHS